MNHGEAVISNVVYHLGTELKIHGDVEVRIEILEEGNSCLKETKNV